MADKGVFLIQSSGETAEHSTGTFSDRTYADEVIKHSYYRNESWRTKTRDQDFGKVKVGDYILHYCTTNVESYPGQIKNIYEVVEIESVDNDIKDALRKGKLSDDDAERLARFPPHVLRLRTHMTLNKGLKLSLIRKWVEEAKLSTAMNNCGRRGFNICEANWKDYEMIIDWNKDQTSEPPQSTRYY